MTTFLRASLPLIALLRISIAFGAEQYTGYLVYDEEMIGFFPCGGGESYGIAESDVNVENLYRSHKEYLREPLFFDFLGEETDSGSYVFGPSSPPAKKSLRLIEVDRIERHSEIICGAEFAREIRIETLYKRP